MRTTARPQALPRFTILAAADGRAEVEPVLHGLGVEMVDATREDAFATLDGPAILLLSAELVRRAQAALVRAPDHVVLVATDARGREAGEDAGRLFLSLEDAANEDAVLRGLRSAVRYSLALLGQARTRAQLDQLSGELAELNKIGMALMSERDPDTLLNLILTQARRLTTSDAGSLYLVENRDGKELLHFLRAQNDTLPDLPSPDFTLPLDRTSIAGYVALTGEPLAIADVYNISEDQPFSFNRAFDQKVGYRAKAMLVVPMKDHKDRVVGVLQLINRKRDPRAQVRNDRDAAAHVLSYGEREIGIVQSLAGQAAVSIENGRLYRDIENLFEGFIKAAVTAIDQRDPTTSGHSVRVATLTCDIAEVMDRVRAGPFADVRFTREQMKELRYAGLLHDFGKVGVREEVLVKSKKLPPVMLERIEARFDLIRRTLEAEFHRRRADYIHERGRDGLDEFIARLEEEFRAESDRVLKFQQAIRESNEPRILPEASAAILEEIATATFPDFKGASVSYLTSDELHYLSIAKGSLDPDERKQIESHVTHTYNFLTQIPWTEDLSRVAEIAYGHHEKLDGTGYPRGVNSTVIPVQTRIMTVSDIFDALTASDRPYKKALPPQRALEILDMEGKSGQLDAAIVQLLLESQVYKKVLEEDWRRL
jgi:HD-GYP domain-containing protein (c-di-GMP phosphodiesterase class II)